MFNFCIDCAYLSVKRVNGIGENSNFSTQLRAELHCASPIPYHVFISCEYSDYKLTYEPSAQVSENEHKIDFDYVRQAFQSTCISHVFIFTRFQKFS